MAPFWVGFPCSLPCSACRLVNRPPPFCVDMINVVAASPTLSWASSHITVFNGGIWQGLLLTPDLGAGCVPSWRFKSLNLSTLDWDSRLIGGGVLLPCLLQGLYIFISLWALQMKGWEGNWALPVPRRKPLNMDMAKKQVMVFIPKPLYFSTEVGF